MEMAGTCLYSPTRHAAVAITAPFVSFKIVAELGGKS